MLLRSIATSSTLVRCMATQWRRKMVKPFGANLLDKKYCGKIKNPMEHP